MYARATNKVRSSTVDSVGLSQNCAMPVFRQKPRTRDVGVIAFKIKLAADHGGLQGRELYVLPLNAILKVCLP